MHGLSVGVREDLIGDMLALGAVREPGRALFTLRGAESRTYGQVNLRANAIANGLLSLGVSRGDRIAVWAEDSVAYMETYMAAARAGFVVVPVNTRFTGSEARFIIEDSDAQVLLIGDDRAALAEETFEPKEFSSVVALGSERPLDAISFDDLAAGQSTDPPPRPAEEDLFMIAYTSGTTGFPKGAMLTHRSVKNLARMNAMSYHLPLYSVAAYTGSMSFPATVCAFGMSHLYVNGTVHLMGKWDPGIALDTVIKEHANFMYVPTPGIEDFCDELRTRPEALDHLTTVLHSASKASSARLRMLAEAVGDRLVEGWGMTEISGGIVTATTRSDFTGSCRARDLFASVGRATVDAAIEVVDVHRNPLPHDGVTEGELAVRSASLMAGYWRRPEATADAIADGWYFTGDIGSIDEAGYVYVSDRRTDLIVSGGMNVYPSEVEAVIAEMPEVAAVAVVGVPHERYGQTVAAAIVLKQGRELTSESVIAHCRSRLASFKKPTVVRFASELPTTVSLKIRRSAVREQVFPDVLAGS